MSEAHVTTGAAAPVGGLPVLADDLWTLDYEREDTANVHDKTLTVPANEEWHVLYVYVDYTPTADAGVRQIRVVWYDAAGNIVGEVRAGATFDADTRRYLTFAAGLADLMAFRDTDNLMTPLPVGLLLQTDWDIRIYASGAPNAGDDMTIVVTFASRVP